jgi:dCMP deaminase
MASKEKLDKIYMNIARETSSLSLSMRKQVGAIIVKDNNILSFGFNGTPSGMDNSCEDEEGDTLWYVLHAESNAIAKVAKSTSSSEGATMYCTLSPCNDCAKMIIQAGIKRVVYKDQYREHTGLLLLETCGVKVDKIK